MIETQSITDMKEERKMLNVRRQTWERLQSFGKLPGSPFTDLFNRLLTEIEDCRGREGERRKVSKK